MRSRRVRTLRRMNPGARRVGCPRRQGNRSHRFAGGDFFCDPVRDALPPCCLPDFDRTAIPAETPAYRQVEMACFVSNIRKMTAAVVKHVAIARPKKARLRM